MRKFLICLGMLILLQPSYIFAEENEDLTKINFADELKLESYYKDYVQRIDFFSILLGDDRKTSSINDITIYYGWVDFPDVPRYIMYPRDPNSSKFDEAEEDYQVWSHLRYLSEAKNYCNIEKGYPDGTFHPFEYLKRQDMYLFIYRYIKSGTLTFKEGVEIKEPDLSVLNQFNDKDELSKWTAKEVSALLRMGIYRPFGDELRPNEFITYKEANYIVDYFYDNFFKDFHFN